MQETLCLFGPIPSRASIQPEFSVDGGFMNKICFRYFCLAKSSFQKRVNMVSLMVGKMCEGSHECSFDLVVGEALIFP